MPGQQAVALTGDGIALRLVGEREQAAHRLLRVERGLAEAHVELAAPRAGHVRARRVEDQAPLLVLVEPQVERGGAGSARSATRRTRTRARGASAHGLPAPPTPTAETPPCRARPEAEPDDRRVLRPVDEVVDPPRARSRPSDARGAASATSGRHPAREAPRRARDGRGRRAACSRTVRRARRDRRARRRGAECGSGRPAAARRRGAFGRNSQRTRPVTPRARGHVQRHQAVLPRHVGLPADPRHGVAVAHQEAVAEVLGRRRVGHADGAVEHAERDLAPAVGDVEQQRAGCRGRRRPAGAGRSRPRTRRGPRRCAARSSRSVMLACIGWAGSTAKRMVPAIFS